MGTISRSIVGILCGVAAALIWGGGAVVSRHLVTTSLDPLDLALLRYAGCFPIALVALAVFRQRLALGLPWRRLAMLLILAGPPYQLLVIAGYAHATAAAGTLLISGLLPAFSLIVPFVLSGTRPSPIAVLGTALAGAGLGVFGMDTVSAATLSGPGLAIFTAAALLWAVLNACVRHWHVDPLKLTVALALWSPMLLPVYLFFHPNSDLTAPWPDLALQLVYHGWLVAFVATLLFFTAVRLTSVAAAASLQALAPGFSAGLGALLLAETLSAAQATGIAVTGIGIAVVAAQSRFGERLKAPRARPAPPSPRAAP